MGRLFRNHKQYTSWQPTRASGQVLTLFMLGPVSLRSSDSIADYRLPIIVKLIGWKKELYFTEL